MKITDLIDNLRRFPQEATVRVIGDQLLVDTSPLHNDGVTVFDAGCFDCELPPDQQGHSSTRWEGIPPG